MEEIWKEIEGYDGYYEISNFGRVRSYKPSPGPGIRNRRLHPIILKPANTKEGYKRLVLWENKNKISKYTHRLVALTFLPNPNNLEQVNHKDGNRSNNYVDNLEWVSRRENSAHGLIKKITSSKYIGVRCYIGKKIVSWNAHITVNYKLINLGRYYTELEAHQAVVKYMEEHGITNRYLRK